MCEAKAGTRLPAAGISSPYMAAYCCCVSWSPIDEPPEFRRVLFSLENTLLGGPRRLGTCVQGGQQQRGHNPPSSAFRLSLSRQPTNISGPGVCAGLEHLLGIELHTVVGLLRRRRVWRCRVQ